MKNKCQWLPELVELDLNNWENTSDFLYRIFLEDFIKSRPIYNDKGVYVRRHPEYNGKHDAYFHLTCKMEEGCSDRTPDLERCKRIKWPRKLIENHMCSRPNCCNDIKIWKERYRGKIRINFLKVKARYILIIEEHDDYYLLVTAFHFEFQHRMIKKLKEYDASTNKLR